MIKRNYVFKTYKRIIITSFQPRKLDDFFYQIRNGSKANLSEKLCVHRKQRTLLQTIKYT